jgi:hypothetical protein
MGQSGRDVGPVSGLRRSASPEGQGRPYLVRRRTRRGHDVPGELRCTCSGRAKGHKARETWA